MGGAGDLALELKIGLAYDWTHSGAVFKSI
jgi:hypothetical protein